MIPNPSNPARGDLLDAFAVEFDSGGATLERYLRTYPQYAEDLIDLSRELSRGSPRDDAPLTEEDQALIETAWQVHRDAEPAPVFDPLAALSVEDLRGIAKDLNVPRQVVTAFRERRVVLSSVPQGFLARFATAVDTTVERFLNVLSLPPATGLVRSYKADTKPEIEKPVSFEQLLIDAGVSDEMRSILLTEND